MANITIDGKSYTVADGITIIQAIDELEIDLPRYCYHPGLSVAGNCRICQVEVEKMPRTVIACNTRVADGMAIHTRSPKAKASQETVLEFILANHPLDCPVCDQAGECKLQDYYMDYGLYDPKFDEMKVKKNKKAFAVGPTVMLDQERCILCSRCVRFADEITHTHDFGIFNRGDHSEIDVFPGHVLDNRYSGNVVDICPVGALTDRDFRFKMRVWYLGETQSVCPGCSRGCNTFIHYEKSRPYHFAKGRVMRLKPRQNDQVNRWWMCDEGRYGYRPIDEKRIVAPRILRNGRQVTATPKQALDACAAILKNNPAASMALLASGQYTNEEIYLQKKIFMDHLGIQTAVFYAQAAEGFEDDFLIKKDKNPNTAGAEAILGAGEKKEDVRAVVDRALAGQISVLVIFHHDLAALYGRETLENVRRKVRTLVYEGTNENPTAAAADLVLAGASYAEKEGTFTNFQMRVQRIRKALEPLPQTMPAWDFLLNLGSLLGRPTALANPAQIFEELARNVKEFQGLSYKSIGASGASLKKS